MDLASLSGIITHNYEIEPILGIEKTLNGSGNTFHVNTESANYIAKQNERLDFILLYDKVESILSKSGYVQSKIIRTVKNELITPESVALYTFLHGIIYKTLTMSHLENALIYMKQFNAVLLKVPFASSELQIINNWDKAKSIDFLINHFQYRCFPIKQEDILLMDNQGILAKAPKQLIHSDLGPDNFVFQNDAVYSIIDFTPEYENELYSFCQFCYWNYFWFSMQNKRLIEEWLRIYYQRDISKGEKELFNLLMIKTAIFRIAGSLMAGNMALDKRFDILKSTINDAL